MNKNLFLRLIKDKIFYFFTIIFTFISMIPLILILIYLIKKGISVINFEFLFSLPASVGESGGGIIHSIVGTLILIFIASIFAIPLGIGAGIYLSENKNKKFTHFVEVLVDILQGIPSIVIGIIAYLWFVLPMKSFSALAGGISLAIMMLPIIIKTTEETLKLVPDTLKEASYALGATYHKTIFKVVLPAGLSGILSGILLGISRIAGETAPLLFTAFGNNFFNLNIFKPIDALPLLIFNYATSPYENWHRIAWGASFLLVIFILGLNITTRWMVKQWKK